MKGSEVFTAAADILEQPGRWHQDALFRDKDGNPTPFLIHEDTHSYTLKTALWAVADGVDLDGPCPVERLMAITGPDLDAWNDAQGRTQAEVVAALRAAA